MTARLRESSEDAFLTKSNSIIFISDVVRAAVASSSNSGPGDQEKISEIAPGQRIPSDL